MNVTAMKGLFVKLVFYHCRCTSRNNSETRFTKYCFIIKINYHNVDCVNYRYVIALECFFVFLHKMYSLSTVPFIQKDV